MTGGIEVRALHPSDSVEALTELLHHAYASLSAMGLNYTAAAQTPDITRERIACGECLVALDRGRLIGTILLNRTVPNFVGERLGRPEIASVHQFAVAPECQQRGLGSLLLAKAEERARALGFAELALDTAAPAEHLVSFYRRRGYLEVGSLTWDGKTYSSIIMSKQLGGSRHASASPQL